MGKAERKTVFQGFLKEKLKKITLLWGKTHFPLEILIFFFRKRRAAYRVKNHQGLMSWFTGARVTYLNPKPADIYLYNKLI